MKMVEVTQEYANNYRRILAALGMEEEGDPVAAVGKLIAGSEEKAQLVYEAMLERDSYMAGNTELLELLMKMCLGETTEPLNRARDILIEAGLMNADRTPNWQALEARKPKQQTWEQAVNECITDPAVRARLLAMDETPNAEVTRR